MLVDPYMPACVNALLLLALGHRLLTSWASIGRSAVADITITTALSHGHLTCHADLNGDCDMFRTLTAAILFAGLGSACALAQSAAGVSVPRPGTPGSNVLFGGAAGSPRPVEQTTSFGNSAESVYSTGRPLFSGATSSSQSGGLTGTLGTSTTGGLFQYTTRVPTGGTAGLPGTAASGGNLDIGTSAGTGGLNPQYANSLRSPAVTGGKSDQPGPSQTGGQGRSRQNPDY